MQVHSGAWLGAFTAVYLACTIAHAVAKKLWFDEIYTVYVSRLPGWAERLSFGSESPPLFYFLTRVSQRLFGWNSVGVRMPEIVGFWLMCVCLFFFVRRGCPAIYGFLAMLIPLGTGAYYYAFEARPYGLILGMAGLSLLCWQCCVERRRRKLMLVLLALSIAFAVNSHFYGAQIVIPLLAGETWRAFERRRIDWGMLSVIVLGLAPLAFLIPLAHGGSGPWLASVRNSQAFWAKPGALTFAFFYVRLMGPLLPAFVLGGLAAFLAYAVDIGNRPDELTRVLDFPRYELAACTGYLLVPPVLLLMSWLKTGLFIDRYALTAVVGCTILLVRLVHYVFPRQARVPAILLTSLFCFWILNAATAPRNEPDPLKEFNRSSPLALRADRLPIVVPNALLFAQLAYYSPPELRSRFVYLADPADAVRRPDFLPELGLVLTRSIRPDKIEDYAPFLSQHGEFWLYCLGVPRLEWLPSRLKVEGWKLTDEAHNGSAVFYHVRW